VTARRKLDFVVLGLPRGGTTATAAYLSAVPGIHCGIEVFPTFMDHSALDVPEAFLSCADPLWSGSSAEDVRAQGDQIRWFGNKTPTYFYRLPTLLAELDNCPAIVCLRDLPGVAGSYARRAANPKDKSWDPGRVGLFALGDALLLMHALLACPPQARVLLVPQAALAADWRAVMTRAVAHVAPGAGSAFDPERLAPIERRRRRSKSTEPPPLGPVEARALRRLTQAGVTAFFAQGDVRPLAEVRTGIATALAQAPANPIRFLSRMAEGHPAPGVRDYLTRWSRHAAKASRLFGLKGRPVTASKGQDTP
jgi:hypothetical protein